jgi:hypothetical protein
MLTSVSLAYFSSSGDRALKARIVQEQRQGNASEGTRVKATKKAPPADAPKPDSVPAPAPAAPASSQ